MLYTIIKSTLVFILPLLLLTSILGCEETPKDVAKDIYLTQPNPWKDRILIDSLLRKSLEGDKEAYGRIANMYMLVPPRIEFYYYALVMATKYNHPKAYHDLYLILYFGEGLDGSHFESNNPRIKHLALYYLLVAYEKAGEEVLPDLEQYFPNRIPTSEEFGCNYNEEASSR